MVVETAQDEIDRERIWRAWELPAGARCEVETINQETKEKKIVEAIFIYMDWAYWRWETEDWIPLIFRWEFKQIDETHFKLL